MCENLEKNFCSSFSFVFHFKNYESHLIDHILNGHLIEDIKKSFIFVLLL